MAWTNSKIFAAGLTDALNGTAAFDYNSDALLAALFDNSVTPDQNATAANSARGAGTWAAGGVSDATGWPAAGRQLLGVSSGFAAAVYTLDAADTVSANSNTTLAANYGCLLYDDTLTTPVADQGVSFHYFGGAQQVTGGTYTIVWNAAGIITYTL